MLNKRYTISTRTEMPLNVLYATSVLMLNSSLNELNRLRTQNILDRNIN